MEWGSRSLCHLQGREQCLKVSQMCLLLLGLWALEGCWRDPENHGAGPGGCPTVPCWPLQREPEMVTFGVAPRPAGTEPSPSAGTWACSLSPVHAFLVPATCHAWTKAHRQGASLQREINHLINLSPEPFIITMAQPWFCYVPLLSVWLVQLDGLLGLETETPTDPPLPFSSL